MSSGNCCKTGFGNFLAITAALLLLGGLVCAMKRYTAPAPINHARSQERARALTELRAENKAALETIDWADKARGLVRLPIQHAAARTITAYKDPAAARKDLLARVDKATAPAPVAPSAFE